MTHCRYCNRFRLTRLTGRGAWLLECGHTYLPLPSEAQRWAAYTRVHRSGGLRIFRERPGRVILGVFAWRPLVVGVVGVGVAEPAPRRVLGI